MLPPRSGLLDLHLERLLQILNTLVGDLRALQVQDVEIGQPFEVRQARIGLGGMAYRPWRAHEAEAVLAGQALTPALADTAAREALKGAVTHGRNDYKPELGRRTLVRALFEAQRLEVSHA